MVSCNSCSHEGYQKRLSWDFSMVSLSLCCYEVSIACLHAKSLQSCPTLCDPWTVAGLPLCPSDSLGKNTGVGWHALLQEVFLTQGLQESLKSLVLAGKFFATNTTRKSPSQWQVLHIQRRPSSTCLNYDLAGASLGLHQKLFHSILQ